MPIAPNNLLAWIVVILFAVTAVVAILDMVGVVEIRKEYQRKGLFSALILEIAGLGIAAAQDGFGPVDVPVVPDKTEPVGPSEGATNTGGGANPNKPSIKAGPPVVRGPGGGGSIVAGGTDPCSVSHTLCEWVKANLPPRPQLPGNIDKAYPPCVATVRSTAIEDVPRDVAQGCSDLLHAFNRDILLDYQNKFYPYRDKINSESRVQASGEIRDFLKEEFDSLTNFDGRDYLRFNELSNRWLDDVLYVSRLT